MKHYKFLVILLALAVTFSCQKVLDKTNLEAIDQNEIWNDLEPLLRGI